MSEPIPFDLHKLIKVIFKHGQAVLNLFYTAYHDQDKYDRVVAVIIKDGKSEVAAVTISRDIKSRLENYQLNLQSSEPNPKLYDLSEELSINAGDIIPSELLSKALQAKELIIVPHGILHLVPWAGLSFKGKRLFEYCPIGILPNVSCILNLNTDFSSNPQIALLGPPDYKELPYLGKPTIRRCKGSEKHSRDVL